MDDSSQEVLKEIPLYFTKELLDELILLQYPVRPANMTYNECDVSEVKFKPEQKKLELSMIRNRFSTSYDMGRGEQIAINADGPSCDAESSYFKSGFLDKHTLSSCCALDGNSVRYAAAYYCNNACVLSPINCILHMRPSFNYLNKSEKEDEVSDPEAASEELKAVTVKFAKRVNEVDKQRTDSINFLANKAANEKWIPLNYHDDGSFAQQEIMCKFSNHSDEDGRQYKLSKEDYLRQLIDDAMCESHVHSSADIFHGRLSQVFMRAQVLSYNQLVDCFPTIDAKSLMLSVQQVAVIIQGNWVVKSEILYNSDAATGSKSNQSDFLIKGRDSILLAFHNGEHIDRHATCISTGLSPEEIEEIMIHIGVITKEKKWRFRLPPCDEVANRFPEIHQRQQMLWEKKKQVQEGNKVNKPNPSKGRRKSK